MNNSLLELREFRALLETGAVRHVALVGTGGGFALRAKIGLYERTLAAQRGGVRILRLDTAARLLRSFGVMQAELDLSAWSPKTGLLS